MSRALLLRRPSPFSYPGGNPGFDPSHVAAGGVSLGHGFSGVSTNSGGGFISLLSGARGIITGTPTSSLDSRVGPCWIGSNSGSKKNSWAGQSSINDLSATLAAIVFQTTSGISVDIISTGTVGGYCLEIQAASNALALRTIASSLTTSTVNLLNNTPYFLAASYNGAKTNFVAVNLSTGQVQTSTTTASLAPIAPAGTYNIGVGQAHSEIAGGISAVMFSPQALSLPQLLQWAQDPWSFWYPRTLDLTMMLATSASGAAYTLSGAEGAFTISGQAAALNKAMKMAGAEGAFTISGQAAAMLRAIKLGGAEGAFTISGSPATLNRGIHLGTSQGAFTINGQAAVISHGANLAGGAGAFTISGQSSKYAVALSVRGAEGAFTISGAGAVLTYTPPGGLVSFPGDGPQVGPSGGPQLSGSGSPQVPRLPR